MLKSVRSLGRITRLTIIISRASAFIFHVEIINNRLGDSEQFTKFNLDQFVECDKKLESIIRHF